MSAIADADAEFIDIVAALVERVLKIEGGNNSELTAIGIDAEVVGIAALSGYSLGYR